MKSKIIFIISVLLSVLLVFTLGNLAPAPKCYESLNSDFKFDYERFKSFLEYQGVSIDELVREKK